MKKIYRINLSNNIESNEYLRCLWFRLRVNFGKLAWSLTPLKIGNINTIFIGHADLGQDSDEPIYISCTYSKKGCLNTLTWEHDSLPDENLFEQKFKTSIDEAFNYKNYKKEVFSEIKLEKEVSFNFCKGKNFTINGNKLSLRFIGYDTIDHETFITPLFKMIKCLLIFDTLKPIGLSRSGLENLHITNLKSYAFTNMDTDETITEWNLNDKLKNLSISNDMINYIDSLLEREANYEQPYNTFEKSVSLFSQGILFEELNNSPFYLDLSASEYAVLCYMSALEVISINDVQPSKCNECGQDKYSIANRVLKLATDATGNNPLIKFTISEFYSVRSKFVHTGQYLSTNNYIGTSTPLLSINNKDGIISQRYRLDSLISELIKECILWHVNKLS